MRNPEAVRPWQQVLSPLAGYLRLAEALYDAPELQGGWNFGPPDGDARPVRWIVGRLTELRPDTIRWELEEVRTRTSRTSPRSIPARRERAWAGRLHGGSTKR